MGSDRLPTIVGFAGTLVMLALLVLVAGLEEVMDALSGSNPLVIGLVILVALGWMTVWGLALQTILAALGAPIRARTAVLVYTGAIFSNNVTPFGQAGGEPLSALFISSAADSEYETGLAAIASVDALHFIPSIGFGIFGLMFVAGGTIPFGRDLVLASVAIAVLAVSIPLGAYLGWRYRYQLEATFLQVVTPVVHRIGRVLPWVSPPGKPSIESRIEGFFASLERIATDRATLLRALGFSALGWLALMVSLWLSLHSVGVDVPFIAVLVAIPAGGFASVTPLPGGSGAIEAVIAGILASFPGVSFSVALSAALIHRGATYLLPTLIGAGVASRLGAQHAGIAE